jgi:phage terminase large subunit
MRDLFTPSRYKAFHGGRGGSKSHSFAQALILMAAQKPLRILCCRETQKSIRDSVKRLLDDKIARAGLKDFYDSIETEIRGANGSLFVFAGLRTDPDTIRSIEGIDIAWVEEAHNVSQASLKVLIPTIRKDDSEIWFSWNPRDKKDPVDAMFRGGTPPPRSIIREVNWDSNPWFPNVLRDEMEYDRGRDPDKYAHVWGGGYVVHSESRVFRNWKIGEEEIPADARPYYGGDWGFSTDPSVLVRSWLIGPRKLYIDAEAYRVGCAIDKTPFLFGGCDDPAVIKANTQAYEALTADEKREFKGIKGAREWPIKADSARPETIDYMQRHGYPHIVPAIKGPGSVEDGVEFLKSYDITVHPECVHVIDELTYYSYKVDKLTGEVLPVLEDKKNHTIDSIRYSTESIRMALVGDQPEQDFLFDPAKVQVLTEWPQVYALDIDGGTASVIWGAHDPHSDTVYLYGEYVEDKARLETWAAGIRKRGRNIPGIFDMTARRRTEEQGERIVEQLLDQSLDIYTSEADVESAASEINARIATQQFKVASNLTNWLTQYRAYRRDAKGDIVEERNGLMHATGLLLISGLSVSHVDERVADDAMAEWGDSSRNPVTGY